MRILMNAILKRSLIVAMVLVFFLTATPVYAQQFDSFTTQDLEDINGQTPWYGPLMDGCTIEGGPTTVTGNNIKDAFLYFVNSSRGFTPVQAAGILGNLIQESGVDPKSDQPDGPGRGIAQWSEGARWEELKAWVAQRNGDPLTLQWQLEFMWYEMTQVPPWNETVPALKKETTIPGATRTFEATFERADPDKVNMPRRIANAQMVIERAQEQNWIAGISVPTDTTTPGSEDGLCGDPTIGQGNVNTQGFSWPVADQKKRDYGTAPCNKRTCHHDGTAAFDLFYGGTGNMDGKAVYAITDGVIAKLGVYRGVKGCYAIQFRSNQKYANTSNPYYYWYGHLQNPKVRVNGSVKAGQQIAEVGANSLGNRCRGGRDHLHIDRGCVRGNVPQRGGSDGCRDGAFVRVMDKLWEELPAP